MSVEEWRVVSYINPKNSIRQIGKAAKMSDIEIRKIIYGLLQAGLVELVRAEGEVRTLPGLDAAMAGHSKEEQKNLVNRLIGSVSSLTIGRMKELTSPKIRATKNSSKLPSLRTPELATLANSFSTRERPILPT